MNNTDRDLCFLNATGPTTDKNWTLTLMLLSVLSYGHETRATACVARHCDLRWNLNECLMALGWHPIAKLSPKFQREINCRAWTVHGYRPFNGLRME